MNIIENKLSVRLYGVPIGHLEKTEHGKMHFAYNHEIPLELSHSLPLKEKTFDHNNCLAYFGGLLPESSTTKEILAKKYNIDSKDIFSFLAMMGKDCPGAVSFNLHSEPTDIAESVELKTRILSEQDLKRAFSQLPNEPLFFEMYQYYPLLSGDSSKVGICFVGDKIAIPLDNGFTTHILKLKQEDLIYNEYFCLKMARYSGLKVPDFCLKKFADQPVLILKRYDREIHGHRITRRHQEDICQALGSLPSRKYERDKGVGFREFFKLLDSTTIPARERHRLIMQVIFNMAINNTKAHAKNFSMLWPSHNTSELAPFYDLYCDYHKQHFLAMSIGEKWRYQDLNDEDWRIFCEQIEYTAPIFKSIRKEHIQHVMSAALLAYEDFEKERLPKQIGKQIVDCVKEAVAWIG